MNTLHWFRRMLKYYQSATSLYSAECHNSSLDDRWSVNAECSGAGVSQADMADVFQPWLKPLWRRSSDVIDSCFENQHDNSLVPGVIPFREDLITHWGQVTHIHVCVSNLSIFGSDNGLSPDRRQSIIWTNGGMLLTGPLETHSSAIFKKMHLKLSSGNWRPFCLGLNVLTTIITNSTLTWTNIILGRISLTSSVGYFIMD